MIHEIIHTIAKNAQTAAQELSLLTNEQKNAALLAMAAEIKHQKAHILAENAKDLQFAKQKNLADSFIDRLALSPERVIAMAKGLEDIAALADPVGVTLKQTTRPNGLVITRVSVPIGVIGVIYESRPNVTVDAAGLCLKSGNAVILRGGSESFHSATAIMQALTAGLQHAHISLAAIQMIPTSDREAVSEMLKLDKYIDVIIPRGGQQLIERISAESRIPLFKHLAGLCHTYIHQAADKELARKVVVNAKMRRTGICGATEVLLIDKAILKSHLKPVLEDLLAAGCEIRGDEQVRKIMPQIKAAKSQDFDTEFLDAIIAVKIVENIAEAISHIRDHGTKHTEAIITTDQAAAAKFFKEVDSAIVMHNTSTQFADGGEFGMGAEIGIATGKLHARGPVGIEQLTTFKYQVQGDGQVRAT